MKIAHDVSYDHLDRISLRNLDISCIIGLYPIERESPQRLELDLDLWLDASSSAYAEDITKTIDYAVLTDELRFILQNSRFQLLETAAEALCHFVISGHSLKLSERLVQAVKVELRKPKALEGFSFPALNFLRHEKDVLRAKARWNKMEEELQDGLHIVYCFERSILLHAESIGILPYYVQSFHNVNLSIWHRAERGSQTNPGHSEETEREQFHWEKQASALSSSSLGYFLLITAQDPAALESFMNDMLAQKTHFCLREN